MVRKYFTWLATALICSALLFGCTTGSSPFVETETEGTDPYCNALEVWDDEIIVSAVYSDPSKKDQIELGLEPDNKVVDVEAAVHIEGAEVAFFGYDHHGIWLLLVPLPNFETIVVEGTASCKNKSAEFILTLGLDAESENIDSSLVFPGDDPNDSAMDGGTADGGGQE